MYNLFVTANDKAWDGEYWNIELSRCVAPSEYTDDSLASHLGRLDEAAITELKRLPCLFAFETFRNMPPKFGAIRDLIKRRAEIRVQFEILVVTPFLSAQDIENLSSELDIGKWEMNRTHWAVKDVDLPKALKALGIVLPTWSLDTADPVRISEVTRRSIIDFLNIENIAWSGRYGDDDFLGRLYDLSKLPSRDPRHKSAAGDIWQHTVNNPDDWPRDWVFYDDRFNLLYTSDKELLRFLCETVHPVVRDSEAEARKIVAAYNEFLTADGWQFVEGKAISGKPTFVAQSAGRIAVFEEPTGWRKVDRQLQEAKLRLDSAENEEQWQAVGLLCREALISVAQEVFDPALHTSIDGVKPSETDAKRMLDAIFATELKGSSNDQARAHARAAVNLALALQHKRMPDFRTAALCAEGTFSVVNMLAILANRRARHTQ
jgi:AbiJ N-terminal domain 3